MDIDMALDSNSHTALIWEEYFKSGIGKAIYSNSDTSSMHIVQQKFSAREPIHLRLEALIDSKQIDEARAFLQHNYLRFFEVLPIALRL